MEEHTKEGRSPFYNRNEGAIMQMDSSHPLRDHLCHYPQIQLLDEIHHADPNATFALNYRPISNWIDSTDYWNTLHNRMIVCDLPGFPTGVGHSRREMALWHCGHVRHIREFVAQHPSHALIELDLYNTD